MDGQVVGLALRRVRLRRNERQADVARRAGLSTSAYSLLERGHLAGTSLRTIRAAAAALEVRIDLVARWRGGRLDRLLHGRHSRMSEQVATRLRSARWEVTPEVSFSHFGQRGVIDLVAWRPASAALVGSFGRG